MNRPSDETIQPEDLTRIHRMIARLGINSQINRLAECESALVAYAIASAEQIRQRAETSGAPTSLTSWLYDEIIVRMLVIAETQMDAHYQLWRDLMGDTAIDKTEPQQGDPHESK